MVDELEQKKENVINASDAFGQASIERQEVDYSDPAALQNASIAGERNLGGATLKFFNRNEQYSPDESPKSLLQREAEALAVDGIVVGGAARFARDNELAANTNVFQAVADRQVA